MLDELKDGPRTANISSVLGAILTADCSCDFLFVCLLKCKRKEEELDSTLFGRQL
jgi:hypothetical protein